MIKFIGELPRECIVACSGGVDSMAIASFLSNSKRKVHIAYFNHQTSHGFKSEIFLKDYFKDNLIIGTIKNNKSPSESWEEYWRNERYAFLHSFNLPVITAHHLGDQVENWIFTSFHGNPKLIPYANKNVIRPFVISDKNDFVQWCKRKDVPWIEDESNQDVKYMRNKIRNDIIPHALVINPGLPTVIRKKIMNDKLFCSF